MEQIKIPEKFYDCFEHAGRSITYAPGETVYLQGDSADCLYLVKRGRVRAFYVTRTGKELTYEIIEKGKIIGESSFECSMNGKSRKLCLLPTERLRF